MEPISILAGFLGLAIAIGAVAKLIIEPVVKFYGFKGDIKDRFHSQAIINQDLRNSHLSLESRVKHFETWAESNTEFNIRRNEYRHNPMSDSDFVRRNPD